MGRLCDAWVERVLAMIAQLGAYLGSENGFHRVGAINFQQIMCTDEHWRQLNMNICTRKSPARLCRTCVDQLQTSGWYSLVMRYDFFNEFPSKMKLNMSNADEECDAGRQIQPKLPS